MKQFLIWVLALNSVAVFSQTYVGELQTPEGFQYMKIVVENDSSQLSFPYELRKQFDFPFVPEKGKKLEAEVGVDKRVFTIQSKTDNSLVLNTSFSGLPQNVILKRQKEALKEEEWSKYIGNFIDSNGNHAIVYERRGYLHLMSPYAEQTVSLKPIGEHQFWSTSGESSFFKNDKNGKFQTLEIRNRNGQKAVLNRGFDYTIKEDWVQVDGDSIYVNLFIPDKKGKNPACLLLPGGGGQAQMDNAVYEARFFASHGMVAMTFEKSGVGKSKGEGFEQYTFQEKTQRYAQLFQYLQNREETNPEKVGIHGPSEGGRLALMLGIELGKAVAFINATAAPIMSMKEGQLYAVDHYHRNQQVNEAEIVDILNIWKDYYDGIISNKLDTLHFEKIRSLQVNYPRAFLPPLSADLPLSPRKEDLMDDTVAKEAAKISCPVLLQYGENDQRVNPYRSIQNFYQNAGEGKNITVEIYSAVIIP
ncbi:MAG: alpha/beta hydrolase [Saprospiraceae bacterium]